MMHSRVSTDAVSSPRGERGRDAGRAGIGSRPDGRLRSRRAACAAVASGLLLGAAACSGSDSEAGVVHEALPGGGVLVRHLDLPSADPEASDPRVMEIHADLTFGARDGDPAYLFGDVRGVQAASDGTIYVLDYQAREVRVFSPAGEYLRTIVRSGDGPGEIREANGMVLSGDTLLWLNDHGRWVVMGVDPLGTEVRRFDKPVLSYGYIWDGAFDARGRYWRAVDHGEEDPFPRPGPREYPYRLYFKSYDLESGVTDSVFVGETVFRSVVAETNGGSFHLTAPFQPSRAARLHPPGGFWQGSTGEFRIARTSEAGDTVLVIEAALPEIPVTPEDRAAFGARVAERGPAYRRAVEEAKSLMPATMPVLDDFFADHAGRLWARRAAPHDALPFFDVFTADGDHLASVRLHFRPVQNRLDIRHGAIHAWALDDLDVPTIIRAPLALPAPS